MSSHLINPRCKFQESKAQEWFDPSLRTFIALVLGYNKFWKNHQALEMTDLPPSPRKKEPLPSPSRNDTSKTFEVTKCDLNSVSGVVVA